MFHFSGIDWRLDYNDTAAGDNYTGDLTGNRFITMTAVVPEPSATTFGLLALAGLALRRRRA